MIHLLFLPSKIYSKYKKDQIMKHYFQIGLLFIALVMSFTSIDGQRVGFDTETVKISYLELPTHPVDLEFTAYSASVSVRPDQLRRMGTNEANVVRDYLNIPGLTKVSGNSFFHIEVIMDEFTLTSGSLKSGPPTARRSGPPSRNQEPVHFMEAGVSMPIALKVTNYRQEVLLDTIITDGTESMTFRSREFRTAAEARNHWGQNISSEMSKFRAEFLSHHMEAISNLLATRYGYKEQNRQNAVFEVLGNSRHPRYDEHQAKFQIIKGAFSELKYDQPIPKEAIETVNSVIGFWKTELNKLDPEERQERRLMYSCLYNIVSAYYWIEDFDNALKYIPQLEELDIRSGRVEYLKNLIYETRSLLQRTGFASKHLNLDELIVFDEAKLPEVTYSTEQDLMLERAREARLYSLGVRSDAELYAGTLYYSDGRDPLNCDFYVRKSSDGNLSLLSGSENLVIISSQGSNIERIRLNKNVISGFTFDNREFVLKEYSPGMSVSLRANPEYLEVLYTSENIQLYLFYPTQEASVGNTEREFVVRKGSDDELLSLHGRRFLNFNRGLARYFEDCEEINQKAEDGEFARNRNSMIKLGELYDACIAN